MQHLLLLLHHCACYCCCCCCSAWYSKSPNLSRELAKDLAKRPKFRGNSEIFYFSAGISLGNYGSYF
jgi:hypothetical protein